MMFLSQLGDEQLVQHVQECKVREYRQHIAYCMFERQIPGLMVAPSSSRPAATGSLQKHRLYRHCQGKGRVVITRVSS